MTSHPHDGDGRSPTSATEHFLVLQRQSRGRRWSFAIVLGATTGVFANLVLDLPLALLTATVTVVGLLWWDSQHGMLMAWWPGHDGPHRLAAAAARLERHGWTVLPALDIPNHDPTRTIYLLIGPGGVFTVEHQVWTVEDAVTTSSRTGLLLVAGRPAARRTAAVRAVAAAVEELLSEDLPANVPVKPVLAVDAPTLDQPQATVGVTILPSTDLTRYLRTTPVVVAAPTIAALANTARDLFTPP